MQTPKVEVGRGSAQASVPSIFVKTVPSFSLFILYTFSLLNFYISAVNVFSLILSHSAV